jgi:hypothetical protein
MIVTSHATKKSGHKEFKRNGKLQYIHRYTYEKHYGKIPDGLIVRHKCDNPSCINIEHLELGTHADNVADRVSRGRSAKGSSNGRAKLNELQVMEIKKSHLSNGELALFYNVDRKVIYNIRKNKTWKHVVA